MKATDLMLGDLVTFRDCQKDTSPAIIKVWQINADNEAFVSIDGNDGLDEIYIDDEVVGIPLTPEILEKNGFENDFYEEESVADYHTIRLEGYSLRFNIGEIDGYLVTWCNGGVNVTTDFCGCIQKDISFVHELQHALRLCGIDKEINL